MLLSGRNITCRDCTARVDLTTAAALQSTGLGVTIQCKQCGSIWTYRADKAGAQSPTDMFVATPSN